MADPGKFGYQHLEIYRRAHDLAVRVHKMTLGLPAFETYEEGSQVRRSSKSVSALIVEGYALRKYRDEFLHYLHRALASADETKEHLRYLQDTGSVRVVGECSGFASECERLSASIGRFIVGVERDHSRPLYLRAGPNSAGPSGRAENRESRIENRPRSSGD
ncbi:MAG TPA: four helix bundle protein [Planctomycetota bacterium]|nr:four helix bundle protein [Planctomycetota bacterium]